MRSSARRRSTASPTPEPPPATAAAGRRLPQVDGDRRRRPRPNAPTSARLGSAPATPRRRRRPRPTPPSWRRAKRRAAPRASTSCAPSSTRFEGCALKGDRDRSSCSPTAIRRRALMFVGEAPGRDEDIEGLPFVGRSGQAARPHAGGDRARPHAASTSPTSCRGGRPATARRRRRRRRSACRSSSARSSSSIPTCWSASASRRRRRCSASRKASPRRAAAGSPSTPAARDPRHADLHPAYLLRTPLQKRLAWRDLLAIKKALAKPSGR